MGQEHEVDRIYRQQFDSISMDCLSQLSLNFDPERGSLLQSIKITSHHTLEQKWLSLFGKYWLVRSMQNDTDVKKMHWLMIGGNHGTIDTCGENTSLHCDESYYSDSLPKGSKG